MSIFERANTKRKTSRIKIENDLKYFRSLLGSDKTTQNQETSLLRDPMLLRRENTTFYNRVITISMSPCADAKLNCISGQLRGSWDPTYDENKSNALQFHLHHEGGVLETMRTSWLFSDYWTSQDIYTDKVMKNAGEEIF